MRPTPVLSPYRARTLVARVIFPSKRLKGHSLEKLNHHVRKDLQTLLSLSASKMLTDYLVILQRIPVGNKPTDI